MDRERPPRRFTGGQVAATQSGKIELVAGADGTFQVWLLDTAGKVRPTAAGGTPESASFPLHLEKGGGHGH